MDEGGGKHNAGMLADCRVDTQGSERTDGPRLLKHRMTDKISGIVVLRAQSTITQEGQNDFSYS